MDNAHIGVAYHGRVREMCAGSVIDAIDVIQVVGYLDVASYNNKVLTCTGWAYANGDSQKVTIKLYKNNAVVHSFNITANLSRTDVKNEMGYATDKVGYVLNQILSLPDGTYEIKTFVGTSQLTNVKTFTVKNVAILTNKSYPDYIGNKRYHIKKSFKDWETSKGIYRVWKNAFNQWKKCKDNGYHIYDNEGKQLD